MPQDKLLALRELCRNRYYLIDMASDLKRKITALLDQVFPEFEAQFSTIWLSSSRMAWVWMGLSSTTR
mgnify:CR=1 FL=1